MTQDVVKDPLLFRPEMVARATGIIESCRAIGLRLATAESCTGGLVAALLTEIAGSSVVVDCGFVTYSNEAKADLLGVAWSMLESHGAVSEATARAMALGALNRSRADIAVAITGIAGPGGGSAEKPVGLVHFTVAATGRAPVHAECRFGSIGRQAVRLASVDQALAMIEQTIAQA